MTTEAQETQTVTVTVLARVDHPNANGRVYPRGVVQRSIDAFMAKPGHKWGPIVDVRADVRGAGFEVERMWIEEDAVRATVRTLPTESGKRMASVLKVRPELHLVGFGSTDDKGVIQPDFTLIGVALTPARPKP